MQGIREDSITAFLVILHLTPEITSRKVINYFRKEWLLFHLKIWKDVLHFFNQFKEINKEIMLRFSTHWTYTITHVIIIIIGNVHVAYKVQWYGSCWLCVTAI